MGVSETAKLVAELTLDDKLSKGVRTAMGSIGKLETGMSRVGRGAGQVSAGLSRAGAKIGIAAVGGVALATKAFIDWEDAFQGVVKTVDEADLGKAGLTFKDLADGLRKMATEMPNSADELAGIAEQAGALGVAGKDILSFTKQVAILASTTNVSAEDAATALGQMKVVIGLTGDEIDNFAAALVDLGNKGNSTEADILEIARRSGGAAKLMHVAKDETLGWSAAAANLGLNQELAGTALQSFFVKTRVAIAKNGPALDKIADIAGTTAKKFKDAFKKDATGALTDFLKGLSKMSEGERIVNIQELFGKSSGLTRLLIGLTSNMDNLTDSLDTGTKAWKDATAAQAEFDKRNATLKSGLLRLQHGLTDLEITFGEGVAPAIGRAAAKLSAFLSMDSNRSQVKKLGQDLGEAIDKVDWAQVLDGARDFVDVLKIALDYAKRIFDAVNALPTQVKAAGLGFIALDKLSGGLIGTGVSNIVGGLAGSLAKGAAGKVPGLGKLIAQPVFVTNWPVGGLGGVGGAAGAGGGMSTMKKVGAAVAIAVPVAEVIAAWLETNAQSSAVATEVHGTATSQIAAAGTSAADLHQALAGVEQGIKDIQSNPLLVLVQGDALTQLQSMRSEISAALKSTENNAGKNKDDQVLATDRVEKTTKAATKQSAAAIRDKVESANIKAVAATNRAKASADAGLRDTAGEARFAGVRSSGATDRAGGNIVAAIHGIPAPIVNVRVTGSEVTKTTTEQDRNGGGGPSRSHDKKGRAA